MKQQSYNKKNLDFIKLLREVTVEKAPFGFTERVLDRIIHEKEPSTVPIWLRPKPWIILSVIATVGYLFVFQFNVGRFFLRNQFYLIINDLQQFFQSIKLNMFFIQLMEWINIVFITISELISFSSFSLTIEKNIIYIIPIVLLILSQKVYMYTNLIRMERILS